MSRFVKFLVSYLFASGDFSEPMDLDDIEESAIVLPDLPLRSVSYEECCLCGDPRVSARGHSAQRKKY